MILTGYKVFKQLYPNETQTHKGELFALPDKHYWEIQNHLFSGGINLWKGGRGSAKTHSAVLGFLERCSRELLNVLLVRREYELTKSTMFKYFCMVIDTSPYLKSRTTRTADTITFIRTGSQIIARGVMIAGRLNVDKVKGMPNIRAVWFDEIVTQEYGNEIDYETFIDIIGTVGRGTGQKGIVLASFNPISINKWVYGKYYEKKDPNVRYFDTTYKDNPFISSDWVIQMERLKDIDYNRWNMLCNGAWGVIAREQPFIVAFDNSIHVGKTMLRKELKTYYCVDFNYYNPCALVIQARGNEVNVVKEFTLKTGFVPDLANLIRNSGYFDHTAQVVVDMTGFSKTASGGQGSAVEQFITTLGLSRKSVLSGLIEYNGGLKYSKANLEHEVSHRLCNFFFNTHKIKIDDTCTKLIFDLIDTEWIVSGDKGKMTKGAGDADDNRNALDCLRYFVQAYCYNADSPKKSFMGL